MGASGWDYHAEYDEDPAAVLAALHRRVLDTGDYYWPDDEIERPGTMAELREMWGDEEYEALAEEGTHSILDIHQVKPAGSPDEFGTIMPLSDDEVVAAFGPPTPTRAQFDAAYRNGTDLIVDFPRWSGRLTALYDGGQPVEIVVWGYSGD